LNFTFDATMEDNSQQSDPSVQLPTAVVTASAISEGDYVAYTTWQNTHAWVPSPFGSGPGRQPASTPQQQSNQHFVQCPKPGFWSNVGHALTNFGSDVQQTGKESAQIGLVTGGTGIVTSAVGLPGEPLIFTGAVFLGAGALGEGVGIVLRLAGGGILAVEGNSQPLQSATVDMAQSHLNDQLGIPPGLPSPTQPVADALSGGNPCP
ncbi:MAG TPA: hypothetical protein VGR96_15135, partial [Acidobacteriaceae bacterium]|nr:hypothetical protein [Acidobacteriaceae bacterium]